MCLTLISTRRRRVWRWSFGIRCPIRPLLKAAAEGKLATRDQIAEQAGRMLDDPRARLKIRQSLLAWLRVDQPAELVKDDKRFPDFDPAIAADLRTSMELFLDEVVSTDASDFASCCCRMMCS